MISVGQRERTASLRHMATTFDFSGTHTVITGGSGEIGMACGQAIREAGGDVTITTVDSPERAAKAVAAIGPDTGVAFCNVSDEPSVAALFANVKSPVNFVIHCAGISPNTPFDDQTQAEWDQVLSVNTTGSFLVTKYAARAMSANPLPDDPADWRGSILLITSTNGINSNDPVSAHYDASKAGANMLARNAAAFYAKDRISVNGLAPGWIDTALNDSLPDDVREQESAKIWTGRWAKPAEIGVAALHLLEMPYFTGQVVLVDGGY